MRAVAVFPDSREIRLIDHPEPTIESPTGVKVKILEVGICGTDREIAAFQYGSPPSDSPYLILGHESLGEVVETGPAVSRVRIGDLVVLTVRRPCAHPECIACRAGRQDFCYTGDFTERGIKGAHGYLTEFVVDDETVMNRVPSELREFGVLTEPLTIAEKGLAQVWEVQQRLPKVCPPVSGLGPAFCHRSVVLGAGPVGLLGAMVLLLSGFETTVYSRNSGSPDRAELARSLGAAFLDASSCTVEELAKSVGNIDLVYEATGAAGVSFDVLRVLGTNGVFVFTGVPGRKAPISLDAELLMRNLVLKNQIVFGTVNAPRESFETAIHDLGRFREKWPEPLRRMIAGRFPLTDFRKLLLEEPFGIKSVITFA